MAGKYTPLENYLRDLPDSQREVTLSFEQIERILNDKLPPSPPLDFRILCEYNVTAQSAGRSAPR